MRKVHAGVPDCTNRRLDIEQISQKRGLYIVGFYLFDREMTAVDHGGSAGTEKALATRHLAKIEISGVVDDTAHIGVFVVDSYSQVNPFFYFSKVV